MTPVLAVAVGHDLGAGLRQAFFMFWATLWPLVLGFTLSGAVQAFVPTDRLRHKLGDHRPGAVLRATGFGMVSSSCSYAATSMARSLYRKGADFVAAVIFMFSSTNLVVELGVVLLVLLGWQFLVAEFTGGLIMIALLAVSGGVVLAGSVAVARRGRRLPAEVGGNEGGAGGEGHAGCEGHGGPAGHGGHEEHAGQERHEADAGHHGHGASGEPEAAPPNLRSASGWADAATYTMADLGMLRRELLVGYLAAGFLAALVPVHVWNSLFIHGHGIWTSLENVVVGPLVAILSCVCSIGNVPLAAALWHGGISFGGVVSFIFADLIALPLLLVYRRYYGWRLAVRLLVWFWAIVAIAGLAVQGLATAVGVVPGRGTGTIVADRFEWNYTAALNIVFLLVLVTLYWLHRNQSRLGGGQATAIDPVCGMQVRTADAPAFAGDGPNRLYFCSERCRDHFLAIGGGERSLEPARPVRSSP